MGEESFLPLGTACQLLARVVLAFGFLAFGVLAFGVIRGKMPRKMHAGSGSIGGTGERIWKVAERYLFTGWKAGRKSVPLAAGSVRGCQGGVTSLRIKNRRQVTRHWLFRRNSY